MHRVAAPEKHGERHPRAVVVRAGRPGILPHVDIRFHHVPSVVHEIAKHRGDVVRVLPRDLVLARWGPETGFAGRDAGFADQVLPFVKIGALLGNTDHDPGRAWNAIAVPIAWGRWGRAGRDLRPSFHLRAAGQ